MSTIYVKPAPDLPPAAAKVLKSDTGVGLLDAAGNVPEAGMPWPNGGLTLTLLRDGAILRADDPVFAARAAPAAAPITPAAPAVAAEAALFVPSASAEPASSVVPAASTAPASQTPAQPAADAAK